MLSATLQLNKLSNTASPAKANAGAINSIDQQTQRNAQIASETKTIAVATDTLAKEIVENTKDKQFEDKA